MDYKNATIIAIDPGKSGGIATFAKNKPFTAGMPSGVRELEMYLKYIVETYQNPVVFIEKVQAYVSDDQDPGKKFGINKMLANYTELITVIKLLDIPFVEVYPISWLSSLGLHVRGEKLTVTEKKNRNKRFAENAFPELGSLTLKVADAVCVLQFALQKISTDIKWINEKIQNKKSDGLF